MSRQDGDLVSTPMLGSSSRGLAFCCLHVLHEDASICLNGSSSRVRTLVLWFFPTNLNGSLVPSRPPLGSRVKAISLLVFSGGC